MAAETKVETPGTFRDGFVDMIPLWAGVIPFAVAFAILARTGGFNLLQTQMLSLFVFAGAAQVAIVTLTNTSSGIAVVLTVLLLNLRHALYSLSLSSLMKGPVRPPRPVLAYLLTDEAYGVTVRAFLDGRGSSAFLFGAGMSLYLSFNLATLAGALLGALIPNPGKLGLDFIFPLTFLALLLPLLRSWRHVAVAAVSGGIALVLSRIAPGGVTILVSGISAATLGTVLDRGKNPEGNA